MSDRLRVGVISSVHGVHGECKIYPTTDDISRFKELKKVYIEGREADRRLDIEKVRFFNNMVICKFAGIETPEDMQKLRGSDLMVDREDASPLGENEYYIADLIGCRVIDEDGRDLGECSEVFPTGANQVMEVKGTEKSFLMPYIKECILNVDIAGRRIYVHMLDGLMDL